MKKTHHFRQGKSDELSLCKHQRKKHIIRLGKIGQNDDVLLVYKSVLRQIARISTRKMMYFWCECVYSDNPFEQLSKKRLYRIGTKEKMIKP